MPIAKKKLIDICRRIIKENKDANQVQVAKKIIASLYNINPPKKRGYEVGVTTDDSLFISDEGLVEDDPYSQGTIIYSGKRKKNPAKRVYLLPSGKTFSLSQKEYSRLSKIAGSSAGSIGHYLYGVWGTVTINKRKKYKNPIMSQEEIAKLYKLDKKQLKDEVNRLYRVVDLRGTTKNDLVSMILDAKGHFRKKKNPKARKRIWYIVEYPRGGGKIVRGPKKAIWKKKYPGPIQGPYYLEEVRHLMQ